MFIGLGWKMSLNFEERIKRTRKYYATTYKLKKTYILLNSGKKHVKKRIKNKVVGKGSVKQDILISKTTRQTGRIVKIWEVQTEYPSL